MKTGKETQELESFLTWKIPGIIFINVDLLNQFNGEKPLLNLSLEVKPNKLLISWMEAKTRQHHIINFIHLIILLSHTSLLEVYKNSKSSNQTLEKSLRNTTRQLGRSTSGSLTYA